MLEGKYNFLQKKIEELKEKNSELTSNSTDKESIGSDLSQENKKLLAKLNQLHRLSTSNITPNIIHTPKTVSSPNVDEKSTIGVTPKKPKTPKIDVTNKIYEVENLIGHKGRINNRQFLVRWKGFDRNDDTWEREKNLHCSRILDAYKKQHRLQ